MTEEKGVIDRIEDGLVTILTDNDEYSIKRETIEVNVREGDWLTLILDKGELIQLYIDVEKTNEREKKMKRRLERLRQHKKSKFSDE